MVNWLAKATEALRRSSASRARALRSRLPLHAPHLRDASARLSGRALQSVRQLCLRAATGRLPQTQAEKEGDAQIGSGDPARCRSAAPAPPCRAAFRPRPPVDILPPAGPRRDCPAAGAVFRGEVGSPRGCRGEPAPPSEIRIESAESLPTLRRSTFSPVRIVGCAIVGVVLLTGYLVWHSHVKEKAALTSARPSGGRRGRLSATRDSPKRRPNISRRPRPSTFWAATMPSRRPCARRPKN